MNAFTPPYRMDRNANGGSIALYLREDIPSRQISFKKDDKHIKHFFVQMKLRNKKGLISCSFNLHLQSTDKRLTK